MSDRSWATLWLGRKDFAVLVAYVGMLCVAVSFYQPWEDEGRAWMLSRSFEIIPLVFRTLRYEGHPALWYLLLWGPAHLHMPFTCINWISAAFGTAGIYVLLRLAPFPFYLRALLPFSFFLAYQYAVVARSYVLFPLLGFLVAHLYRKSTTHSILMAVVLGLLANVSIHGTIVAAGFAVLYAERLFEDQRTLRLTTKQRRDAFWGAGIFAGSIIFVAACLWPTQDLIPPLSPSLTRILHHFVLPVPASSSSSPLKLSLLKDVAFQLPSTRQGSASSNLTSFSTFLSSAANIPNAYIPGRHLARRMAGIPHALGSAFASFYPLAFAYQALLLVYLYRRHKLTLILPAALLFLFLVFIYASEWHLGLLWITLLMALWAAWDSSVEPRAINLQNAVAALLALLCILQLPWTFGAIRYEKSHNTYPAEATANYLKTLPPGKRIQGLGHSFTVLPYFSRDIFIDDMRPLGSGPGSSAFASRSIALLRTQPDLVLADDRNVPAADITALHDAGYRDTHSFCGAPYYPNLPIRPLCFLLFEKP